MNPYFTDYSDFLARKFPGVKVQKISVNAGFSCPNRDGTIGTGGCIYCNVGSFSPGYCMEGGEVTQQIEAGKAFFGKKYPEMKYLAYFQSFTNTHGDLDTLLGLYREALDVEDVIGVAIGTRPDCVDAPLLEALAEINREMPVLMEYGAETSHDATLQLVNRGHTWQKVEETVRLTAEAGLSCGLHLIAFLPGETAEDVLVTVDRACRLPIDTLKIHQLQVVRGTRLHAMYERGEIELHLPSVEEYLNLCAEIVKRVPKTIALERFVSQSPPGMLVAPCWGLKNYQFSNLLLNRLARESKNYL